MTARKNGLIRIFWPSDAPRGCDAGVLVGWRNSEHDILVISILEGLEPRSVEHALRVRLLFRSSPHPLENILDRCGGQVPQTLGTINMSGRSSDFDARMLEMYQSPKDRLPKIKCPASTGMTIQVLVFNRPDPKKMQYLSLDPISLALTHKQNVFLNVPPFDRIDIEEEAERNRKEALVEKLKLHTVVHHARTQKELALQTILDQINCSTEIRDLMRQNAGLVGIKTRRSLSVTEKVAESAADLQDHIIKVATKAFLLYAWPFLSQLFKLWLMIQRTVAELFLIILEWRPFPDSAALRDVSATAQQLDIRLQQFCYWPAQYITLHRRRTDWDSISNSHTEYIRFFNSLWLVANDVIIGIALGSFIIENADAVAHSIKSVVQDYAIDGLQQMISWLMDDPAGLKLNNELAAFLGDFFLRVINYWAGCMRQIEPALPYIVRTIGFSSFAGASLPIAMTSDIVSLLTIHIYSFYIASARIYSWQLTVISSLFHLFRGKKRNVLRNRIDSCDYDLDQLLLGTILFTVLFFLLPTVAVFYATFALARMGIIGLKAALDTWLACLNHFPLFAIMLRLKDAQRLPGGIRFELVDSPQSPQSRSSQQDEQAPVTYIKLESIPLPIAAAFAPYAQLGNRLRKHYLSPKVLLGLVSGQLVPPIHRKNLYSLQYSMLPARRVSINELWTLLTDGMSDVDGAANGIYGHALNGSMDRSTGGSRRTNKKENKNNYWWNT